MAASVDHVSANISIAAVDHLLTLLKHLSITDAIMFDFDTDDTSDIADSDYGVISFDGGCSADGKIGSFRLRGHGLDMAREHLEIPEQLQLGLPISLGSFSTNSW
jgi:hypothetical protein